MGKTQVKRRMEKRANNQPRKRICKEIVKCEKNCFDAENVGNLLEQLQGSDEDKVFAAHEIANKADNIKLVSKLMEKELVKHAGPLLLDNNPAVRLAIVGCLRNVAICGDHAVCQEMVDQDITSLVTLLLTYEQPWTPSPPVGGRTDMKSEIFLEAIKLLWTLCESSEIAVVIFNRRKLIKILLPCLDFAIYGLRIALSVAQCLHIVGEENPEMTKELTQPLVNEQLRSLMILEREEPEYILFKNFLAAIIMNTLSGKVHNSMSDVTNPIIKITIDALNESINAVLHRLYEDITNHKREQLDKYHTRKDLEDKLYAVDKASNTVNCVLQAKQVALETLTNICFGDDATNEWDDISTSDTSEEMEMDVDETTVTPIKLDLEVPPEIHLIIMHHQLLQKVIDQIVRPPEEIMTGIANHSNGEEVFKKLNTVRCRALLCLNNMFEALTINDMGGPAKLFNLWMKVADLVFHSTDIENTEQLEAGTHLMRAILQKLAEAKYSSQFQHMSESDLELLMNIYHQSEDAAVKVNVIRTLGIIGCLIATPNITPASHKLISVIGIFLLEICSKSSNLWVTAEIVDVIIDLFAEDHLEPIAQEINLVEKLDNLQVNLKGKVKQHRTSLGEFLPVIMTAKTNLIRFIQYKKQHRKK